MDHYHCASCFLTGCTVVEDGCRVGECPNDCGAALHGCKTEDHVKNTCPEALVPCINAQYGCKETFRRVFLGLHLEHCPASVLACKFAHRRRASADIPSPTCIPESEAEEAPLYLNERWCQGDTSVAHAQAEDGVTHVRVPGSKVAVSAIPAHLNLSLECMPTYHSRFIPQDHRKKYCLHQPVGSRNEKFDCIFPCNEVVRRDEYANHYKTLHHDIQAHIWELFRRCPMSSPTGCTYRQAQFLPSPRNSTLRYDEENFLFLLKPPDTTDSTSSSGEVPMSSHYAAEIQKKQELALYGYSDEEDESYDVLGQLPPEVLGKICSRLDSLSLWYLSQVNHYLRSVCQNMAKKKGIVYQLWNFEESSRTWTLGPKVCCMVSGELRVPY